MLRKVYGPVNADKELYGKPDVVDIVEAARIRRLGYGVRITRDGSAMTDGCLAEDREEEADHDRRRIGVSGLGS